MGKIWLFIKKNANIRGKRWIKGGKLEIINVLGGKNIILERVQCVGGRVQCVGGRVQCVGGRVQCVGKVQREFRAC